MRCGFGIASAWVLCFAASAQATEFSITASIQDRAWRAGVGRTVSTTNARIGTETAGQTTVLVIPFLLPSIPAGEVITEASLALYSESQTNLNGQANMDVRGVRTNAAATTLATDITAGTLIADNAYALSSTIPVAQVLTISTENFAAYLRGVYASDPAAAGKYVFITVFPDVANTAGSRYVTVSTADNATAAQKPSLSIVAENSDLVTEPITHNGVTWELLGSGHTTGTFVTGDPWVLGPVTVVEISNNLNAPGFTPRRGQNGSMVNPLVGHNRSHQGYDDGLDSYRESLNAGLPTGQPLSASNPLVLQPGTTLVSMVSWLYVSATNREPGCPDFNGGTDAPRPVTRSAGVLTILDAVPPPNAFRPPYAGADKTPRFTTSDLDRTKLLNLPPTANTPDPAALADDLSKPWIDHGYEYLGAMFHPSEHMPNYGRDMAHIVLKAALVLHLDFSLLPGSPSKDPLLINLIQYGIDTCGVADAGGGWPANGGHHMGRFWPVLFAGILLDDPHMLSVGTWGRNRGGGYATQDAGLTEFQEFQNHFYVSMAEVNISNGPTWDPDTRGDLLPYQTSDIGTPEWGIRHSYRATSDNAAIDTAYRDINGGCTPGFALAARLMGAQKLWNHDPYFDYADRYMALTGGSTGTNALPAFAKSMWQAYATSFDVVSYNDYLQDHFTPQEIADPAITGRDSDSDGDGNSTRMEHYFGTHPRNRDDQAQLTPRTGASPQFWIDHISLVRPPNGRFAWERTFNFIDWEPVEPDMTTVVVQPDGRFLIESGFDLTLENAASYRIRVND